MESLTSQVRVQGRGNDLDHFNMFGPKLVTERKRKGAEKSLAGGIDGHFGKRHKGKTRSDIGDRSQRGELDEKRTEMNRRFNIYCYFSSCLLQELRIFHSHP